MRRPSEIDALVAHFGYRDAVKEVDGGWWSSCPVARANGAGPMFCGARMLISRQEDGTLRYEPECGHPQEEVRSAFVLPPAATNGNAPLPLCSWPDPLDDAAYTGVAGEVVRAIGPHTEADPAAVLVQFLACFGNACGRGPGFQVEADRHHLNLFVAVVGETAKGRKGSSFGQARRPVEIADESFPQRVRTGLSSGEGLIWEVRDAITKRRKAKKSEEDEADEDGYVEVVEDEGVFDKRLVVYESELASVLGRMGRQGNTLSSVVRQAWDGGTLNALTKNSAAKSTGALISIVTHITEEELRRELTATDMANGFANRFLWVCARRSQELPFGGEIDSVDWRPITNKLVDALSFARLAGDIGLGLEARELWVREYHALSDGAPGLFGAVTSRAEAQVRRLAAIYAVLDRAGEVGREHLVAALAVWRYCEESCRHLFGDATGDPLADEILTALRRAGMGGLSRTQVRDLFGRNMPGVRVEAALSALDARDLAYSASEETGGRPAERWFANGGAR